MPQCAKKIVDRFSHRRCSNTGKVSRITDDWGKLDDEGNEKWYCKIHDPVVVEEKRREREAEWQKKQRKELRRRVLGDHGEEAHHLLKSALDGEAENEWWRDSARRLVDMYEEVL